MDKILATGRTRSISTLIVIAIIASFLPVSADTIGKAITDGKVNFDLRYRYEYVDQADFGRNANASTIRLRLGYQTGQWHGLFVYADLEANEAIGSKSYNSTANGSTEYPVVADPEDAELNQGYIGWKGWEGTKFTLGRQRLTLDNHRFLGNVGWRQLEQTFDAFAITSKFNEKMNFFYSHVTNAVRIFGVHNPDPARAETSQSSDLVNFSYGTRAGKVVAYAYLMDLKDKPDASHMNLGLRFTGKAPLSDDWNILYTAEYADQSDYEDAPGTVDADYMFGELGFSTKRFTGKAGYEVLSGDGVYGFQTPFATLHKFNGWADQFLATPADGLEDLYLHLGTDFAGFKLAAIYHEFNADNGGADFGTELDLVLTKTWKKRYTLGAKYAAYDADSHKVDTDKFWFWLQTKL